MIRRQSRSTGASLDSNIKRLLAADEPAPPNLSNARQFLRQAAERLEEWSKVDASLRGLSGTDPNRIAAQWVDQFHMVNYVQPSSLHGAKESIAAQQQVSGDDA